MRDTGASCLAGGRACFSAGLLDLDFAGDALAEELAEPELLLELDDRDVDPLLDDDLDLLPDELPDSLLELLPSSFGPFLFFSTLLLLAGDMNEYSNI